LEGIINTDATRVPIVVFGAANIAKIGTLFCNCIPLAAGFYASYKVRIAGMIVTNIKPVYSGLFEMLKAQVLYGEINKSLTLAETQSGFSIASKNQNVLARKKSF
jgi:ABC-type iron transport system FetAB permease component